MPLLSLSKSPSPSRTEFEPEAALRYGQHFDFPILDDAKLAPIVGVWGSGRPPLLQGQRETWQHRAECLS